MVKNVVNSGELMRYLLGDWNMNGLFSHIHWTYPIKSH